MAEDQAIAPSVEEAPPQAEQDNGPGPEPILSDDKKKELAGIIRNMLDAKIPEDRIQSVVGTYYKKYGVVMPAQPNYRQPAATAQPVSDRPSLQQQTADKYDISQDPQSVARREHYKTFRESAIKDVESDAWRDKIFKGKIPALTEAPNMPIEAFQTIDNKELDNYLATKDINNGERYWLRNQLLNYGKERQEKYYVEQGARKKIEAWPEADQQDQKKVSEAYASASKEYHQQREQAIANRLNNIGLTDKPLGERTPFHDQITALNKTLMGTMNFAGDLGGQLSSLLELGNVPGLGSLGYHLKTTADDLKAKNYIPQTGELGNKLAGEYLPAALDAYALQRMAGAVGRPIYQSLSGARAAGTLGKFGEGVIGGVAISPANSYIMAHQYYNQLVQQGVTPGDAAHKADQLLSKNMMTDMLMTPLQMGLLKMPMGKVGAKILGYGAEAGLSGLHFTIQDFNQKNTDNPAMHILDYLKSGEAKDPMIMGATLGLLQKATTDALHNWSVNSETKNMFSYGRKYGTEVRTSLPSNETIANNVLSAIEMKDTPGRPQELKDLVEAMHESGVYREHEATRVKDIIDDVVAAKAMTPKFGNQLQRMAIFNEMLNIRTANEFAEQGGGPTGEKFIKDLNKVSEARIQRILSGEEPLYFINGNETNKVQLMRALDENPELLSSKGVRIDVRNDPSTQKQIAELKTKQDAIQKQSAAAPDVRPAPGDREAVGGRNEGPGAIDQKTAGEEKPAEDQYLTSRHGDTPLDEQNKVSGSKGEGLSEKGKQQVDELGNELAENHHITTVYSSDANRGRESGDRIAEITGAQHIERADLRTWDIGEFHGSDNETWKRAEVFFVKHPTEDTFEGKKIGETFEAYKNRMLDTMKGLQGEGPNTFVVNHSNNIKLWEAFKNNGREWNTQAEDDYLHAKNPEPATLLEPPEAGDVAKDVQNGQISEDHLLKTIQSSINETTESLQRLRKGDTGETGSSQTHGEAGQANQDEGTSQRVSEAEQRSGADVQDKSTESVPASGSPADETGVVHQAGMADKVTRAFYEEDVVPAVKRLGATLKDGFEYLRRVLSSRYGVAEKALTHIMRALGDRNQMNAIIDAGFHSIEKMFNKMKDADRIAFIDKMKRGLPQGSPELDTVAKLLRGLDEELYNEITKYNPNMTWKENHFRVLWKTIPGSQPTAKQKFWSLRTRRPLEGSRGFMKHATLADMSEGIARGGVPQSTNPITMFKIAFDDGMKYITAQKMFEGLKKDKFVKFVRPGQEPPAGYTRLNDRLANVYFRTGPEDTLQPPSGNVPAPTHGQLPPGHAYYKGQLYKIERKAGVGPVKAGEYWIDPGAGRLLNNHLSIDQIRNKMIGRGLMNIKNAYTAVELGLSGYHAIAEGLEAISSQIGIGLREMVNLKDFKAGAKSLLTAPGAFVTTAATGKKAMKFATSEDFRNSAEGKKFLQRFPEAAQFVPDFFRGGGLFKQHEDLRDKTMQMLKEQASKDNYIGAMLRLVPALHDMTVSPLFNTFIPRLKVGMFFKEFPTRLAENADRLAKGQVTREQLARQTIDFIDDRLGEMNFDNLFWDRTFKTSMQFFLRSVTWKLGNIRAMLGTIPEGYHELKMSAAGGGPVRLPPKAAWLLGLSVMQVALSSVIQHMLAGKGLEKPKDIVAPQVNPDDPNERVMLPTYYKDMLHLYHNKLGYVTTSMSGQLSKVYDVWQNKDFYGYEIYDPTAPESEQLKDKALYLAPKPFSVSSMKEMHDKGEPPGKVAMGLLGLNKAPGWMTHTDIENKIFDLYNIRNAGTKPYKEREGAEAKKEIRSLYRDGNKDEAQEKLNEAVKKGDIRPSQVRTLMKNVGHLSNPSVYFFSKLPFEDKQYLYNLMDDEEKKQYDPKGTLERQLKQLENAKEK